MFAVGKSRAAAVAVVAILLNALAIAPSLMSPPESAAPDAQTVRLIWANLQRHQTALEVVARLVRTEGIDFVALTELPADGAEAVRRLLPEMRCVTEIVAQQNTFATLIASREPCEAYGQADGFLRPSDAVFVDVSGIRIVALHPRPPWNNARTAERDALIRAALTAATAKSPTILVGDFNATPWSHIASEVRRAGFRRAHCDGPVAPTWRSRNLLFGLAIDHAYLSAGLEVRACSIGNAIGSDHWPLILEFAVAAKE